MSPRRSSTNPTPSPRTETRDLILAIQTATPRSRARLPYAARAWEQLDECGRARAAAELPAAIERAMWINHGLVVSIVNRWRGLRSRRMEYGDILAAAQTGALNALYLFDLQGPNEYSTYASIAAIAEILKENYTLGDFSHPESVARDLHRIRSATNRFEQAHGRKPSTRELAGLIGKGVDEVEALRAVPSIISADGFDSNDDDGSVPEVELIPAPAADELYEMSARDRLTSLTAREVDLAPMGKGSA